MSPKLTAGIPSQSGWYLRSRRDFWRRLAGRRQSCRTLHQANHHSQEKLGPPGKAASKKAAGGNRALTLPEELLRTGKGRRPSPAARKCTVSQLGISPPPQDWTSCSATD